jgi:hypothetical protein
MSQRRQSQRLLKARDNNQDIDKPCRLVEISLDDETSEQDAIADSGKANQRKVSFMVDETDDAPTTVNTSGSSKRKLRSASEDDGDFVPTVTRFKTQGLFDTEESFLAFSPSNSDDDDEEMGHDSNFSDEESIETELDEEFLSEEEYDFSGTNENDCFGILSFSTTHFISNNVIRFFIDLVSIDTFPFGDSSAPELDVHTASVDFMLLHSCANMMKRICDILSSRHGQSGGKNLIPYV